MGMVKVKSITLEDGRLIRSESGWVYTGARGTFTGSTPSEALAKAYNVNDAEVKILRFRDFGVKALVCIEGLCELYDVEYEEGGSRG
jgi:hypothetical protein